MPRQRRLLALVEHVRKDPTPPRQEQHRAPSACQELTFHSKGLAAPRAAYHAQGAPMVTLQELNLLALAVSAQQAHTLRLHLQRAPCAIPAVGLPQTRLSVQIVLPVLTTVRQDLRA